MSDHFPQGLCPFCDSEFCTVETAKDPRPTVWKAWVECSNCGASGPPAWAGPGQEDARGLAAYLWNERAEAQTKER